MRTLACQLRGPVVRGVAGHGEGLAACRLQGPGALDHGGQRRGPAAQDGGHPVGHLRHVPDHHGQVLAVARRPAWRRGPSPAGRWRRPAPCLPGCRCGAGAVLPRTLRHRKQGGASWAKMAPRGRAAARPHEGRPPAPKPPRQQRGLHARSRAATQASHPRTRPSPRRAAPDGRGRRRRPASSSRSTTTRSMPRTSARARPRTSTGPPWRTSRSRGASPPGTPKLRVYNPRLDEHGWASPHTVIEIVNDDMPFLVDSVTMELNRQGHTLHLLVHPLAKTVRDAEGELVSFAPAGRDGARESLIHVEVDRESDPARLEALGAGAPRGAGRRARGRGGLEADARGACTGIVDGARQARRGAWTRPTSTRRARSSPGRSTRTSPSSASATTSSPPRAARTSCASSRARGWACCASRAWAACRRASGSCRPPSGRSRASRACSCSRRPTRGPRCTARATSTTSA